MVQKPIPKKTVLRPVDPQELNHPDFRWFILHFPQVLLDQFKIQRTSFVAVGLAMAQCGDYKTGTRVNPTKKALHNQTGAHNTTITKVFNLLKEAGAIEHVEDHQSSNGGKPAEVFRFRRSPVVVKALAKRDAQDWKIVGSATGEPGSATGEPGSATGEPGSATGEDNRNVSNEMNERNRSDKSSQVPAALLPSAWTNQEDDIAVMEPSFEELLADIDEEPAEPVVRQQTWFAEEDIDELLKGI